MEQKLSEQELVRRQKMEYLRAKGIDPFGHAFARTHRSAQLREEYGEVSQEELEEKVSMTKENLPPEKEENSSAGQ